MLRTKITFFLCVRRTFYVHSSPLCVHNWINYLRWWALISILFSNVPLNFGAPALEELFVLEFFLPGNIVLLLRWHNFAEWGETAVIDNDKQFAAFCTEGLAGFHVGCKTLESVAQRKTNQAFILSIFLTVQYITLCLDILLPAFIIRQCFKTE